MLTDVSEERTVFTFNVEDGGYIILRNVGSNVQEHTAIVYSCKSLIRNKGMYPHKSTCISSSSNYSGTENFQTKFINLSKVFILYLVNAGSGRGGIINFYLTSMHNRVYCQREISKYLSTNRRL